MRKIKRHVKILEILDREEIQTQEELAELLQQEGFQVTQATISRDIKDLRLMKISDESGKSKYVLQTETRNMVTERNLVSLRLLSVLRESYISSECARNILVIKTLPGMAQAAASAIDNLDFHGILGTIAGDDTILSVARSDEDAYKTMEYLLHELRAAN